MKITLLTNEYPPYIYGGAGVHVEYLSRELATLDEGIHEIHIFCFGDQKDYYGNKIVEGILPASHFPFRDNRDKKLLDILTRNIIMTSSVKETDIVHCHTWYTHLAGCLIKEIFSIPLVITTHSLEPQRPWKEEQLGSAYRASTWIEKTAYQNADGFPNPISSSCTAMPLSSSVHPSTNPLESSIWRQWPVEHRWSLRTLVEFQKWSSMTKLDY